MQAMTGRPMASHWVYRDRARFGIFVASSYETTGSNFDQLTSQGDFTSALWNRARKNGSGNSLGAYTADNSGHGRAPGNRAALQQSGSDGSMSRHRAASNGSASDHSAHYYDSAPPTMNRSASTPLRHERPVPYDHSRRIPMNQYGPRGDGMPLNAGASYEQRGGDQKSPQSMGETSCSESPSKTS
jgi:translation initiation factor 4G